MLRLLIALRLRLAWNRLVRGGGRTWARVIGAVIATIFGLVFVAAAALNTSLLVQRLARIDPLAPEALLPALLIAATALCVVTSLSTAFHHLFMASDEELLLAAPVKRRDLFALKLLETWRDSIHIVLFSAAALFGYGLATSKPITYFVVAALIIALLTLAGSLTGMCLTLLVAHIKFGNSLLGASRLLSFLLFLPVGVLGFPALGFGGRRGGLLLGQDTLETAAETLRSLGPPPAWAPTTWAVHLLLLDQQTLTSTALLLATAAGLTTLTVLGFQRSFQSAWERVRFAPQNPTAHATQKTSWRASGPVLSMLHKDVRTLLRDPRWRTSLLVSLVALGVPMVLVSASTDPGGRLSADARFWIGLFPIPYLAYVAGSQHGAASLAYEGRNLALLRAAPVGFGRLLLAKLGGSMVLVLGITWLVTLVLALRHEATPAQLLLALGAAAWLAVGGTVAGLTGAALTADFENDNPQRRVGCLGTLLTSGLAGAFFATNTALLVWLVVRGVGAVPRPLLGLATILDWALLVAALGALVVLGAAAVFGARRLAAWEAS